jgi:hypothetical protein
VDGGGDTNAEGAAGLEESDWGAVRADLYCVRSYGNRIGV